ncbi:Clp protease N-terminal domain-containing protein [Streptomyces sp. NBC_00340]|uniref:Clp protease N-terminal domain-containing protein n=1 Tax=Streptomyces sp. NBC_00340 TaxID=2975716 RepID=UPI00225BAAC1|nr:Clp protease N-terminal domain-containing protein [Streptomyces sp. NBC_00340]MCX5130921.1 Clp protease N-terminal domain-containing protein [Streptomyces sp. NBC_00340]
MFERFTKDARAVVTGAVSHSERVGAATVEEEHLLLALLDRDGSRGSFALGSLRSAGPRESLERDLAEARRRGGLSRADADALSGLGIDLSEIVARIEEAHGEGALESGKRSDRGRRTGRRPFGRSAKETLTRSLRVAVARRDRHIGDEHLLLAITLQGGVAGEVLADRGITYGSVTRVLYGEGGVAEAG